VKKVLFVTTNPELGGAQKWTYDQANLLVTHFEIYFATGSDGWLSSTIDPLCKKTLIDKGLYSFASIGYLFRLWRFVKKNEIDMIVASSANAGIYARLMKILSPKMRIVYVSHGWSAIYRGNRFAKIVEKVLSFFSTAILTVSKSDYSRAIKVLGISPKKLVLIENAIPPCGQGVDSQEVKDDKNSISIVMVARFDYPKRQDLLVEVAKRFDHIHFIFVGDGQNLKACQQDASKNISFLGSLVEVESVLSRADIFALLSNSEGMPLAVLEALACGKPLLLSNLPSMKTFIDENGLLVENTVDAVSSAIEVLEKMSIKDMRNNSKKIFDKHFNLLNRQNEYVEFYKNLFM
jgi:glycosyltransferase involved in cell wall biosynthesis